MNIKNQPVIHHEMKETQTATLLIENQDLKRENQQLREQWVKAVS